MVKIGVHLQKLLQKENTVSVFGSPYRLYTVIDDNENVAVLCSALNPCEYNHGGCEQLCHRVTSTERGELGYRCSCQTGILAPDNHTCVSSGELVD